MLSQAESLCRLWTSYTKAAGCLGSWLPLRCTQHPGTGLGAPAVARELIYELTNLQSLYLRCRFQSISPGFSKMRMVSNGCGTCNWVREEPFPYSPPCVSLGGQQGVLGSEFYILFVEKKIILSALCTSGSFLQSDDITFILSISVWFWSKNQGLKGKFLVRCPVTFTAGHSIGNFFKCSI